MSIKNEYQLLVLLDACVLSLKQPKADAIEVARVILHLLNMVITELGACKTIFLQQSELYSSEWLAALLLDTLIASFALFCPTLHMFMY